MTQMDVIVCCKKLTIHILELKMPKYLTKTFTLFSKHKVNSDFFFK